MNKTIFTSLGLLALTGCNQVAMPDLRTTGSVFGATQNAAYEHTIAEKRPVQEAFVKLPEGSGEVLEVTQSRRGNGVEQLIIYRGDFDTRGENAARVRLVVNDAWPVPKKGSMKVKKITAGLIQVEMRKALPGIKMRMSNELHSNAYGPFGYALGRAPGKTRCIYGWQQMAGKGHEPYGIFNKASKRPQLSLRLRVCRTNTSSEELVRLMRHLQIDADPAQALKPTAVSWTAGPNTNRSTALPQYEPGGYVSEQDFVEPQAPAKPARVVRKRKRIKRAPQSVSNQQHEVRTSYNPPVNNVPLPGAQPLPNKFAPVKTKRREVIASTFPVPNGTSAAAAKKTSVLRTAKPKSGFSAVPLPN